MRFERSCFSHLSRPRRLAWEWACPYAGPSWNRTAAGSGRTIIPAEARFSALPFDMWGLIVCRVDYLISLHRRLIHINAWPQ